MAADLPGRQIEAHIAVGRPHLEIARHVAATESDMAVKAAEPLPGTRRLFAGTDQHLLSGCPCPIWLQRPDAPAVPRHVVAAVDLDDGAARPSPRRCGR